MNYDDGTNTDEEPFGRGIGCLFAKPTETGTASSIHLAKTIGTTTTFWIKVTLMSIGSGRQQQGIARVCLQRSIALATESPAARAAYYSRQARACRRLLAPHSPINVCLQRSVFAQGPCGTQSLPTG